MSGSASRLVHVVEDEPKIASVLEDYLVRAGFAVECHDRGDTALERLRETPGDLVLLDLNLPGLDGVDLCRALRGFSSVPVIMVTARVDEIDRLLGLELGADDYVCKPFSPREVVARVRAQLRRSALRDAGEMGDAPDPSGIEVLHEEMRARVAGRPVELTPVEFRILATLTGAPGRVFSRQHLMDAAYTDHRVVGDRTIDTHVKNLRRKLAEALGSEPPLASVYGVGYRWDPHAAG
ncbi:MAG TPA: response regulator [Pseudomonadales bacterium]|nr:response regulator [Pseudomonadales bacterium]